MRVKKHCWSNYKGEITNIRAIFSKRPYIWACPYLYGRVRHTANLQPHFKSKTHNQKKKVGNNQWKVMRHMKKLLEKTSRCDLLLKRILILVLDYPVYPVSLSRATFQISPKMAISSFEKIFDYCQIHAKHLRLFLIKSRSELEDLRFFLVASEIVYAASIGHRTLHGAAGRIRTCAGKPHWI